MLYIVGKLFLLLSFVSLGAGILEENYHYMLFACFFVWLHNIFYAAHKPYKNIIFLLFHLTFFIFLLGRVFAVYFFEYEMKYDDGLLGTAFYDESILETILLSIYNSLFFLYIGFSLFSYFKMRDMTPTDRNFISCRKLVAKYFFFICVGIRLVYDYEMMSVASLDGYYETFSTFESQLPSVLITLSKMYDVAFFAFLATFPKKKEAIIPIALFLVEGGLAAVSGRRSIVMLSILIIIVYYAIRSIGERKANALSHENLVPQEKKWLGKFEIGIGITSFPMVIILLNVIEKLRAKSLYESGASIKASFLDFFYSQGVSVNVIGYTKYYESSIPENKWYSLGPLFEFFDQFRRALTGTGQLTGQSIERAMDGYLFSHTISFLIMPTLYLAGVGYGSSYIAELYSDFDILGVIVGSFLYGLFMVIAYNFIIYGNFLMKTFALLMIRSFFFTPRASFIYFIVNSLSLSKIMGYLIIVVGTIVVMFIVGSNKRNLS